MRLATPQLACDGLSGSRTYHGQMQPDPAGISVVHEMVTRIAAMVRKGEGESVECASQKSLNDANDSLHGTYVELESSAVGLD
ncbi:hypothetical protein IAQ61_009670 [Plenodomus lingam]|uniref:uncharacterized protein n=1 Tax=Leptosphaeria maculans TaxID=5022 RepID=UPI00332B2B30|nr:hypothetical protein IAQ61_009670 [Plenodomus lingam]